MGKIEDVVKSEIVRLAQKEDRAVCGPLAKQVRELKRTVSALKKSVAAMEKTVARLREAQPDLDIEVVDPYTFFRLFKEHEEQRLGGGTSVQRPD